MLDAGSVLPGTAVKIFGQKSDINEILELPPGRVLHGHLSRPCSIGSDGTWVDYEVTTEHKTTIILALPISVASISFAVRFSLYFRYIWYIVRRGTPPTPHHNPAFTATRTRDRGDLDGGEVLPTARVAEVIDMTEL